jgi:hypothetical protein
VPTKFKNSKPLLIRAAAATLAAAGALGGAAAGSAAAESEFRAIEIEIERNALERSLEVVEQRLAYREVYAKAKKHDVAPRRAKLPERIGPGAAKQRVTALEKRVRKAQRPKFDAPQSLGVSSGTLESIAACESGGDPGAVSADGTYRGKYQFDTGTWASVGGSGDPAAAPVAEQDYRAALLYSRAGSSPWPVCGS